MILLSGIGTSVDNADLQGEVRADERAEAAVIAVIRVCRRRHGVALLIELGRFYEYVARAELDAE